MGGLSPPNPSLGTPVQDSSEYKSYTGLNDT